jgi:hypothetical protein
MTSGKLLIGQMPAVTAIIVSGLRFAAHRRPMRLLPPGSACSISGS